MQANNIHYRTAGRTFRITSIFHGDREANEHMLSHPHEGVIATFGRQVFLADVRDEGTPARAEP